MQDQAPAPQWPLISVLVPVYNVERFVLESLQSIALQTYPNFEVIVVDDCSTDHTHDIVAHFVAEHPRFKLLRNESNQRIVVSLNRALAAAQGALIARCDGDDVMLPERLMVQYRYLQAHPDIALVGCSFETIDETGRALRVHPYPSGPGLLKRLLPYTSPVSHIWLATRQLYEQLGGYRLASVEDYDFLLRADRAGFGIDNVPGYVGMRVRMRGNNTVSKYGLRQRLLFNYARKLYLSKGSIEYNKLTEERIIGDSGRGLMMRLHGFSDWLSQRGARSGNRMIAGVLYIISSAVSPYKAQYFFLRIRVAILIKLCSRSASA